MIVLDETGRHELPEPAHMTYLEQYGRQVLDGEVVACHRIKQSFEKLLHDLHHPDEYHFDEAEANRHIEFIERFCKQSQGNKGQPIKLLLFQKAILQAVFGFRNDAGVRKYNECLLIMGRKNGKTTLLSTIMLDMLINSRMPDGRAEGAPECYCLATRKEQAAKCADECHRMVMHSPALSRVVRKRQSDLYCSMNFGIIKALASNTNGLDGLCASAAVVDELGAIKQRDLYDLVKQSMSSRAQPLLFEITTNGFVRNGIFDSQYEYACGVLDGRIDAPHFLPFIYELDNIDEWDNHEMWQKSNPALGQIKSTKFLAECVQKAKDDPSFKPTVMVKDFNMVQNSSTAWLKWDDLNNTQTFDISAFDYAIGGIDAADSIDLAAAVAVFKRGNDDNIYVRSMFWIPDAVLEQTGRTGSRRERDNAPYELWVKQGYMRTCPGNKVDKICFLEWFRELRDEHDIYTLYIGYDPWHMDDSLLRAFRAEFGANSMIPVRQGTMSLSQPMKELQAEFTAHHVIYDNNPILKWCLSNTDVKPDINGNIQPVKLTDVRRRIDGTAALTDAYKVILDKGDEYVNLNREA